MEYIHIVNQAFAANESMIKHPIWPGFNLFDQPIIIYFAGDRAYLIGHPKRPKSYKRIRKRPYPVLLYKGNIDNINASYDTAYLIEGVKCFALRVTPEEDYQEDIATLVHERFHVFQQRRFKRIRFHGFKYHDNVENRSLARLEQAVLARSIQTSDDGYMKYAKMFVAIRKQRNESYGLDVRAIEDEKELTEGMAFYVESHLRSRKKLFGDRAWDIHNKLGKRLMREIAQQDMLRGRYYSTGAAQGMLLDRAEERGWKQAVEKGNPLIDIMSDTFQVLRKEREGIIEAAKAEFDFESMQDQVQSDIDDYAAIKKKAVKEFDAQSGYLVEVTIPAVTVTTRYSSGTVTYQLDEDLILFPDMHLYDVQEDGFNLLIKERPVITGRINSESIVRFYFHNDVSATLDGESWKIKDGAYNFNSFSLKDKGAELSTTLKGTLKIVNNKVAILWEGNY